MAKYRCTVCNWVYDDDKEGTPFADLPDSYTCPVCGAPKSAFVLEGEDEKSPVDEISAIDEKSDQSSIPKTSQSSESTVADKILEQIESFGVNHIYGIPGDSNFANNRIHEETGQNKVCSNSSRGDCCIYGL